MVDRAARKRLGELIHHLVSGQITNQDFDDEGDDLAYQDNDETLFDIFHYAWLHYDDFKTYTMTGEHRIDDLSRKFLSRCVLFLQTDLDCWTEPPSLEWTTRRRRICNMLTLGHWPRPTDQEWQVLEEKRQASIWPFATQEDFDEAKRHPKLLCRAA
jgi:hypothetical protein